ncbi:MAG: tetratricopeptide repeat protein [Myxococcales bacterium]|jgi:tetratricopeptide (TPR) repeat protein
MTNRRLTLVLVVCVLASILDANGACADASLTDVFEAGNIAASKGDYETAIRSYRTLVEAGVADPDVYFNLATAYAQSGDYPRAILNFERALVLAPRDDQTEQNLRAAERALEERRAESEGEATIHRISSPADAVYGELSEDSLAYVLIASNFTLFGCLAWVWVAHRRGRWLYALLIVSSICFVFSAIGLGQKAGLFRDGPRAVALEDRLPLREAPYPQAQIRGEARGGDRAVVVGRDADFLKLRVANGLEGWAPASGVGLVDPDERVH